jgi:transposase-like protein
MVSNSEESIINAISAYNSTLKPKLAAIARQYGVDRNTLRRRINGSKSRNQRDGPNKALEPDQEKAVILWIDTLDAAYSPPSASQIRSCAQQIVRRYDPSRTLGKNWGYDFIGRLPPRFKHLNQKPMEKARYAPVEPGILVSWYDRLQITIDSYKIAPKNIYNFDETGFRIGQGKAQKVVSARGHAMNNTGGPAESLTGIECVSATGWVMPPWILIKGQYHMENWFTNNLPDNYTIYPTANGWTDEIVSFMWIQVFHEFTRFHVKKVCLILFF